MARPDGKCSLDLSRLEGGKKPETLQQVSHEVGDGWGGAQADGKCSLDLSRLGGGEKPKTVKEVSHEGKGGGS